MSGTLYIVPTPVGNLSDMTPRAIEVLQQSDLILAEDTRTSKVIMNKFGIETPMHSHHKYNEHQQLESVISRLEEGQDIALVSDAGTPGISDPGFMLSRECRRRGIKVITLPGATAFVFEGFLPSKKGRSSRISELANGDRTFIIYESPLRLVKTLEQLSEACGSDRQASVSREISKLHETTHRGSLKELLAYFTTNTPKGEIVIIVDGKTSAAEPKIHRNKYALTED